MIHADMAHGLKLVQSHNLQALADYVARIIERLARAGAEIAAISAVTPHICIRELEKITPLPLVNIIAKFPRNPPPWLQESRPFRSSHAHAKR